jgi:predicted dehydrogenase/threonine dehydrogenase-like Zn-dependent dehydrogenase
LKDFFNQQANVRLAQLGHSPAMIRDAKREAWWWLQARRQALARRSGLVSGRAVVWTEAGRAELVLAEVPRPGAGEVTVEVTTTVVSTGTERAQYLGLPHAGVKFPHRPGYSGAGVVIAVGSGASDVAEGDVVAIRSVPHMSVATVAASLVQRVPAGVSPDEAALVQLGVICGQGVRRAEIEPGESVCVIGAGLIGCLAQRIAAAAGAGSVIVVGRSRAKEALALRGGASTFLAAQSDAEAIAALNVPVVIEASGDPEAIALAVSAAKSGGRVVVLGSPRGVTANFPVQAIRAKRLRVIGAHVATLESDSRIAGDDMRKREALSFLDLLADGRLSVSDLVQLVIDPREAEAFYRRLAYSQDISGARFDWTLLPAAERLSQGRLMRLPELSARGASFQRQPLPAGGRPGRRLSPFAQSNPFADASGSLRIAMLGCGDIGIHNAAAIQAAPNVSLAASYDPARPLAEEIAGSYGGDVAPTSEALLERDDVDAVLLCVPHHLHTPLGVEAAAAGKHVIVEKPLANNLAEAVRLVEATNRAGVTLSICFPQRFDPGVVAARRLIAAGALGEFGGLLLNFFMDKPASYWVGGFSGRAHSSWRSSRAEAGGGVLIMNLSHFIDLIRHLTGVEADSIVGRTQTLGPSPGIEDLASLTVQYANGATGSILGTASVRGAEPAVDLRLWGTEGQIAVEPKLLVYTLRVLDGLVTGRWQTLGRLPRVDSRAVYLSRLATAIDRGASPDIGPADGLAVQAFIEAAYLASDSGESVRPSALLAEASA